MFEVIKAFTDLQDGGRKYRVGDVYPRKGYTPNDERIKELSNSDNKRKTPLIVAINAENEADDGLQNVPEMPVEIESDEPKVKRAKKKPETD